MKMPIYMLIAEICLHLLIRMVSKKNRQVFLYIEEEFEDIKGVIRIRISKKNRQHKFKRELLTVYWSPKLPYIYKFHTFLYRFPRLHKNSFFTWKLFQTTCQTGAVVVVIVWQLDLQLPLQSVHITTKVGSSNPVHDEVYSIQHYVRKFVSDLRQVSGFLRVLRFPPAIKLSATI